MKKLIIIIFFAISGVTASSQVTSTELSNDNVFTDYVTKFNSMVDYVSTTFNRNMLLNIKAEIDNVKNQVLSISAELKEVARILKYYDVSQLGILINDISSKHAELMRKYPTIDKDVFTNSYLTIMENSASHVPSVASEGGCRRPGRYALCAAAVGFEGAGLLAACEALTAGIGTPACLAGAVVWAANGIADCSERFCAPLIAQ